MAVSSEKRLLTLTEKAGGKEETRHEIELSESENWISRGNPNESRLIDQGGPPRPWVSGDG